MLQWAHSIVNKGSLTMLELLDYRRRVFAMYTEIRNLGTDTDEAYRLWKDVRDDLFANHSQSALDEKQKRDFSGLNYYAYDPDYCMEASLNREVESVKFDVQLDGDGAFSMKQIGQVTIELPRGHGVLGVYWIMGYGGGIFIPFRDATNGETTYGGGRYLYDTIKGADLGSGGDTLLLDFNYAYHPSCHYNPRWVCPLAPMQNRLDFPVEAGEQLFGGH